MSSHNPRIVGVGGDLQDPPVQIFNLTSFKALQGWGLQHLPGQPIPIPILSALLVKFFLTFRVGNGAGKGQKVWEPFFWGSSPSDSRSLAGGEGLGPPAAAPEPRTRITVPLTAPWDTEHRARTWGEGTDRETGAEGLGLNPPRCVPTPQRGREPPALLPPPPDTVTPGVGMSWNRCGSALGQRAEPPPAGACTSRERGAPPEAPP